MTKHNIKFCENNFQYETDKIVKILEDDFSDVEVEVSSCLGYCGDCATSPFALIDDVFVNTDTQEELLEEIKSYIE
ncbi:hypothetical protein CLPU_4c02370 [Gottschalkia purinilytica]|uniref:DUF1450 domain-containing protein n=1 Tax=Gottschalkia purinilytica TaxID=1503 RepID=A0A0L0WCK4_GOTPU|nr:DUF1450 domain-containing protein [Gottschalkia purinilytica]KNF09191.1 hypothetical protein CLPU_4c02370 [Gottschalkia purinilytica]